MSVVIAAKYKNGVAMIADKQVSRGTTRKDGATKIHSFKYSNSGIGVVGYLRDCNVMRTLDEVISLEDILNKTPINELYVIKNVIPKIINHMRENKRVDTTGDVYSMGSEMLYVNKDGIYCIGGDFAVVEMEDFAAIGCGDDKASGYMTSIKMSAFGDTSKMSRQEIEVVLTNAIRQACEKDIYINDKTDIMFFE